MAVTTEIQTSNKTLAMRAARGRGGDDRAAAAGAAIAAGAAGGAGSVAGQSRPPAASTNTTTTNNNSKNNPPSSPDRPATNNSKNNPPIVVRPDERPAGILGWLQMAGAVGFLLLMGSALYLCIAVALYIVLGFMWGHRVVTSFLLAVWVVQALCPVKYLHQDPVGIKRSWLFREMARYFDMTMVMETALDTSKSFLFAQFPHGTIPIGPVLSAYFVQDVVPGKQIFCLIHSGIFHLPFVRFFMGEWGALPADKQSVTKAKQNGGGNCSIVVGGVAEIFSQSETMEQLQLRKGFIREALRNGYDLVPMFHFGATRMYKFVGSADFWRWLSSKLPFPFFLVGGACGGLTLLPKKVPIVLVVGSPLGVAEMYGVAEGMPVPDPDPAKVDLIYEAFKKDLHRVYYKYRPEWETRDLVIVDRV